MLLAVGPCRGNSPIWFQVFNWGAHGSKAVTTGPCTIMQINSHLSFGFVFGRGWFGLWSWQPLPAVAGGAQRHPRFSRSTSSRLCETIPVHLAWPGDLKGNYLLDLDLLSDLKFHHTCCREHSGTWICNTGAEGESCDFSEYCGPSS